ncbi:hypothetical protein [Caballeronia sp. LZ043]|uniref:hypothetical protein n=1 Tax=Caballeronia sp. LZ043 TaxID=3038569 RepID=UPI002859646B|nr:hypothetical protein [Caballeronia sp. LZ043]MDR5824270.1 hypothetical protein [Caballeronia sp. LZ043]
MSYLFALLQKFASLFESPNLPLDKDYCYQARFRDSERQRKARGTAFGIRL